MLTFPAKARTATDGTLSLAIPTGLPDADVEVLVILEPASRTQTTGREWPAGFFEKYFGALRDEGLQRQSQGEAEEREPFN
jgi:hypothetical protein